MDTQDVLWTIALSGMGLVTLGFLHVVSQAGRAADDEAARRSAHTAHTLRRWLFGVLLVGFVGGTWATLHRYPIPDQSADLGATQVVDVTARMWSWEFKPEAVEAGSVVEFRVSSADVNHGFAIYSPEGRIVAQTQAMPSYSNKLLHTFEQPGTYTVQCLEYCGIGHGPMKSTFDVVAAKGE
jgi:cytochrome c oxidase subunit 2